MNSNQDASMDLLGNLDLRLLAEVRRIELRSNRKVSTDLMGRYRSAFRGSGLSFSDLREYEPGDDVKNIHWKVTARTGKPFIKTYEEDRQLRVLLMMDCSASTGVGGEKTKFSKAVEFAALVSLLAFKSQDQLGLCLFSGEVEEYLPPKASRHQFTRILLTVLSHRELAQQTDLGEAMEYVSTRERRPCIIFLLTDFVAPEFKRELKNLAALHDLIGVTIADPMEILPQDAGIISYIDAETGEECLLDLSNIKARKLYQAQILKRNSDLTKLLRSCGADHLQLSDNPLRPLSELMNRRMARMR